MKAEHPEQSGGRRLVYTIEFPGDEAALEAADVSARITRELLEIGWSDEEVGNFGMVVGEAIVNAAKHGSKEDKEKKVSVEVDLNEERAVATVRDEGEGFDINKVPELTAEENAERASGRGIKIMKEQSDAAVFLRLPGGGMEVRLEKKRKR
jgi:anti-sigma regulatory factor (Ser/Thr protein kinase)